MDFFNLQKKIFSEYFAGRYNEALKSALEAKERFPDQFHRTGFWAACLYCRTGSPGKALLELEQALKKGAWWSETVLLDEDLLPLREREEFARIKEICLLRQAQAAEKSRPELVVMEPPGRSGGSIYPLLLLLHGQGGNIESYAPWWDIPDIRSSFVLAFLQSSQVCGLNQYCWDKFDLALDEVHQTFDRLQGQHGDAGPLLMAGFSQGGALAIRASLDAAGCAGFIAIVPGIREVKTFVEQVRDGRARGRRGCIITGDKDYGYARAVELAEAFLKNDFACKLIVVSGMGHAIPENFSPLLRQAVDFVCGEQAK
jgi:predicted esterase